MPKWDHCKFEDLFAAPLRNGVSYPSEARGIGIPMVNLGEAFAYDFIENQPCERVPLTEKEHQRYLLESGDLLFVRQSLKFDGAGRCIIVKPTKEAHTWESHLIRARLDPKLADPQFYYYYFRSPQGRVTVESIIEQVAAAGIRGSDLRHLAVPKPAVQIQQMIARLLGSLDDKITVNDLIAKTANRLAKEHYWSETGQWSEAGEVSLGEAARWHSGGTPSTTEPSYWNGNIPWISAASMKSPWIDSSDRMITILGAENGTRMVPARTILFVVRGMSLKSEFRVGITQREVAFSQDCKALAANENIDPFYLFYSILCRTEQILGLVDEAGHGTGRLATDRLAALKIPLPTDAEQRRLVSKLRPLAELAAARQRENWKLAELRDALLPKLISGELRIKDAERQVTEVV
jgi:type I restriction enzyme S subunit